MDLGVPDQDPHHKTPDSKEEDSDHDDHRPGRDLRVRPEISPITSVGSTEPIISQNLGDKEPDDQLSSEQSLEEIGHVGRNLSVVVGQSEERHVGECNTDDRKRPDRVDDVDSGDVGIRIAAGQGRSPVPQDRD